jgi:hypothetical protein
MYEEVLKKLSEVTMQWEMAELNRLKQDKNRKYSWPGQLAVYSQTVEVTLYLTCNHEMTVNNHKKGKLICLLN